MADLSFDNECPMCEEDELIKVEYSWGEAEWCLNCTYQKVNQEKEL